MPNSAHTGRGETRLFTGIKYLWGQGDMASPHAMAAPLEDAWMWVEGGVVKALGTVLHGEWIVYAALEEVDSEEATAVFDLVNEVDEGRRLVHDLQGAVVFPAFCDPHTHLVWAGDRVGELELRMQGWSYARIARNGGGIQASVRSLRACPEEALLEQSLVRLRQIQSWGVASLDIKSGYGLDYQSEAKTLRVARDLAKISGLTVQSTFLGLHGIPTEYSKDPQGYVKAVVYDWLPRLVDQGLVDAVDVFVEEGYFGLEDLDRLAAEAFRLGLPCKAHLNQFVSLGGIARAKALGLLSMDHLEVVAEEDWLHLGPDAPTVVGLPLCSLYLGLPYAPLGSMVQSGQRVALGSDWNPGSAPCGNPWLTWSLATLQCGLEPVQALASMTCHAATAMGLGMGSGTLRPGQPAHFTSHPSWVQPATVVRNAGITWPYQVWNHGVLVP